MSKNTGLFILAICTGFISNLASAQALWSFSPSEKGLIDIAPLNSRFAVRSTPFSLDREFLETLRTGDSATLTFGGESSYPLQIQEFNIYPSGDLSWNMSYSNAGQRFSASLVLGDLYVVGDIQSADGLYRLSGKRIEESNEYVGWFYKYDNPEPAINFEGTPRVFRSDASPIRAPSPVSFSDASQLTTLQISNDSLKITLSSPQPSYFIGDDITVTVNFENVSNEAHSGLEGFLNFDPDNNAITNLTPECTILANDPNLATCALGEFAIGETKVVSFTVNDVAEGAFSSVFMAAQVGQAIGTVDIPFGADYLKDTDGDGVTDYNETLAGTDPADNQSTYTDTLVIDVLALYTDDANTPGENDHVTLINQHFNVANQALIDSGLKLRFRPAAIINLPNYQREVMDAALNELAAGEIEATANVARYRSQYGADMIALFMGFTDNCGLANLGGAGMNGNFSNQANQMYAAVSNTEDCVNTVPFIHELGHNLGMNHSRKQDGTGGAHHFSVGHGVEQKFATIMAYTTAFDTTTKIRNFSSPSLSCLNEPCGVDSNDTTNGADSVQSINSVMFQVANFFEQRPEKTLVSAADGKASASRQLGGVFKANANKFNQTYTTADKLFLSVEIEMDAAHVGRNGELISVIEMPNIGLMQLNQQGQFEAWDGDLATLKAATPAKTLAAKETFTVFNQWPVASLARTQLQVNVYTAYRLLDSNELYYTSSPLQFGIAD